MPVEGKVAYHLFGLESYHNKSGEVAKLYRKSKWPSGSSTSKNLEFPSFQRSNFTHFSLLFHQTWPIVENFITSLDFHPNGEMAAMLDKYGVCTLKAVNTDYEKYCLETDTVTLSGKNTTV